MRKRCECLRGFRRVVLHYPQLFLREELRMGEDGGHEMLAGTQILPHLFAEGIGKDERKVERT